MALSGGMNLRRLSVQWSDLFGSTGIHEKEEVAKTSLFALHDLQDTTIPLEGMSADGWPALPIELL